MFIEQHGGSCCGITHVIGFEHAPTRNLKNSLNMILRTWREDMYEGRYNDDTGEYEDVPDTFNCVLEATLTDDQMVNGWAPEMKARGFKLVNRFKNSNSGNYVNVLHFSPAEPRGRNRVKRPFNW
jgi:hypothetical protein